jgi:hypothetical protein
MPLTLLSPYRNDSTAWLRGNLHTHTTRSDGNLSPEATIAAYAALGYDFIMLSDHDLLNDVAKLDPRGMVLISGNEITANGCHCLHVNAKSLIEPMRDRQAVIDAVNADGGFCIFNHPNWEESFNHCDIRLLMKWQRYTGIEVYNGITRRVEGNPLASDKWDQLLSAGRRVWGYADDDNHADVDRCVAWNMVQAEERGADAIVAALQAGRSYASTGVRIDAIQVNGATVRVETSNTNRFYVVTDSGRLAAILDGPAMEYTVPQDFPWGYVRIECFGPGDRMAWTQPFFISRT